MKKFGIFAAAVLLSTTANAAIVYNNGAPNGASGNETVAWVQSEDFTLGANTAINSVGVYLAGFNGIGNWDGQFQYYIFDDNAGNPGTVLASGGASIVPVDTGTPWSFGGNMYLFAFNLASTFNAVGGTTYHLGIHAGATGNFNRDDIYWMTTATNATSRGLESFGGTFNNWSNNSQEHAFYLDGDLIGGVPEPATWGMMLLGFGMAGAAMRRRTKVSVSFA